MHWPGFPEYRQVHPSKTGYKMALKLNPIMAHEPTEPNLPNDGTDQMPFTAANP